MLKAVAFILEPLVGFRTGFSDLCVAKLGAILGVVGLFIFILKLTVVGGRVLVAGKFGSRAWCAHGTCVSPIPAKYYAALTF